MAPPLPGIAAQAMLPTISVAPHDTAAANKVECPRRMIPPRSWTTTTESGPAPSAVVHGPEQPVSAERNVARRRQRSRCLCGRGGDHRVGEPSTVDDLIDDARLDGLP